MNNKQNKNNRITIRLSDEEFQQLSAKLDLSGYKSVGAFIRDHLILCEPKAKHEVRLDVVEVHRELMNLASMLNAERTHDVLMNQIKKIANVALGVAK